MQTQSFVRNMLFNTCEKYHLGYDIIKFIAYLTDKYQRETKKLCSGEEVSDLQVHWAKAVLEDLPERKAYTHNAILAGSEPLNVLTLAITLAVKADDIHDGTTNVSKVLNAQLAVWTNEARAEAYALASLDLWLLWAKTNDKLEWVLKSIEEHSKLKQTA